MTAVAAVPRRLPAWLKQEIPDNATLKILQLLSERNINTVCQQAHCPNLSRCFKSGRLTFLILGRKCSRNCFFCAVEKSRGVNLGVDHLEPERIAAAVESLALNYAVVTSVTRDDLADAGAGQFARTVEAIRGLGRDIKVEILIPDFNASLASLKTVVTVGPAVIGHNIETVERLHPELKPGCSYRISLKVLSTVKEINPAMITKSSLLLGLGEEKEEVILALKDLRRAGCDIVTLGQYLSPGREQYPVRKFITPATFGIYRETALALGFRAAIAGPLVRSSYRAEKLYEEALYA